MDDPHQIGAVTLKVKINPGSDVESVFIETYELAKRLSVGRIEFSFNKWHGVTFRGGCGYIEQGTGTIYEWSLIGGLKKVPEIASR